MSIESLISDLAFLLLLGAVVTVLFKWLRQPVVLGYIVAGFLASPNFTYLPSVSTAENIEFWAQLGIVVLLFSLGLEFSFKKLLRSGTAAVVTALIIVAGMMLAGFVVGHFLGFNFINCLFLGGMLSMSSTTIIIKAFTDMGLRQQKFAALVLAVLIVEDLFAVLMMVILSSIALNNSVEGTELLMSVAKLSFFLIIWFLVGVYVIPSVLNRCRRFLNSETLLVVSMGMCLGMAVFSVYCGFSLALGAFVMGSILAGTSYAESIEHVTTPVKDLFGAVFFISVGMMVQPTILADYWIPILILSAVVILGMIVFGSFGMIVTGQDIRTAIRSGFSLTQIGEFAFIIATLGMSLGVLEAHIYPIIVAVSVITTFTTPYFIKLSTPAANWVETHIPRKLALTIERYGNEGQRDRAAGSQWTGLLRRHLWRSIIYSVVLIAVSIVMLKFIGPWLHDISPEWGDLLQVATTLTAMAPFLLALIIPVKPQSGPTNASANIPRIVMMVFRTIIAAGFVAHSVGVVYSPLAGIGTSLVIVLTIIIFFYRRLSRHIKRIEDRFFNNLNERELRRSGKSNVVVSDLHTAYITVGNACSFAGERLSQSNLRRTFGVNVISIQRQGITIPIPDGNQRIYPGDTIGVIGSDAQIEALLPEVEAHSDQMPSHGEEVELRSIMLSFNSPLVGKSPASASIRNRYKVLVVAVSRDGEFIDSDPNLSFTPGDIVWFAGTKNDIEKLK